jgi:hypothetical protein
MGLKSNIHPNINWPFLLRKIPLKPFSALLFALAGSCTSVTTLAQELDNRELGAGYAQLLGFASEPEISASIVDVDPDIPSVYETELKGTRLPLHKEFEIEGSELRWYAQGSLGYLKLSETQRFDDIAEDRVWLEAEWTAYTGIVELGLIMPLGAGFSLAPGLSAGLSRLENELEISDQNLEELLQLIYGGRLFDWSTNATIGRAHLALLYDQRHGHYRVKGGAHLSYAYVDSYSESSGFAGFADHSGTAIFKVDVSRRINSDTAKRALYLIGHLGNTTFLGDNRHELGFDYFNEAGLSLGIDKYALGVLAVFGKDVSGWSLTFNYNY